MLPEDLDFQIKFFEELLEEDPDFIEALIPLGDVYTRKGLYRKGLEVDLKLASLRPADPAVFYNLACSYALLGRRREAMDTLEKALQMGYRDLTWMEQDSDLEKIRGLAAYRDLLGKYFPTLKIKKRKKESQ